MNVRGIVRGTLASGIYLAVNVVGWMSDVIPQLAVTVSTGYWMGAVVTVIKVSYAAGLGLTLLSALLWPVFLGLMAVCWGVSLGIAVVILARRCVRESPSSLEPLFWRTVGVFGLSLMIGLIVFNLMPRSDSESIKWSESEYAGLLHYLFVSGILVCSLLGGIRPRIRPPALPD